MPDADQPLTVLFVDGRVVDRIGDGLNLLASLAPSDIEWLIANGTERQTIANTVLIDIDREALEQVRGN